MRKSSAHNGKKAMRDSRADIDYEWAIVEPVPSWQDKAPREHVLRSEKQRSPVWGYLILALTVAISAAGTWVVFTN